MSDGTPRMVECPTCAGCGLVTEQEYDEAVSAMDLSESIPVDRLAPWHTVTIKAAAWHMAHPVTCDLYHCPFDEVAQEWSEMPAPVGVYRWHRPDVAFMGEGHDNA